MIRFFRRCGCCIPSTDILTVEDRGVFVERLDSKIETCGSYSSENGTKHSKLPSKLIAPQDRSADPLTQSLPPNCRPVEKSIGATLQDAHQSSIDGNTPIVAIDQQNANSQDTEHTINPESHSDRSTIQVAKQAMVTMFQEAQHLNFSGNARIMNIGHQYVNSHGNYGLHTLEKFVSFNALHDSSAQDPERCCHPGTRKKVLDKMCAWMDDPNAPERLLWLYGPAGVGKSAIAQTISHYYGRNKIGATFFFFKSDPVRNDGNRLFPTLAWQLASSVPIVKDLIAFSLEEYPDIPRKAIEVQFDQLIAQPFLSISGDSTAPTSTRVIIIDGLDECSDEKLQERILKIIGKAVSNTRFPLRFIISSRPEAHIQDLFDQFQSPTLQIDLAKVEDAFRDIKTYFISEFSRIAVEQQLESVTWPDQFIIDTLVWKSSGQFVYASTVMKYIGDKYESAVAQLNVILGLEPSTGRLPFSELDALYTEILKRQPSQNFLKGFLPVLVARSMLAGVTDGNLYGMLWGSRKKDQNLHEDDAMLLGLDEKQLRRKLRGTRALLKFEPFIDVHHKSFFDFLDDPSRSGEYHISKHFANRRYLELITDTLVKAISKAMEQPDCHEGDHFKPRFATVIQCFVPRIELPLDDLDEVLQPLLTIQENLLQLPNMSVPWKPRACDECWTFYIIDDLFLHLSWFRGTIQLQEPKYAGVRPLTAIEEKKPIPQLDLDACLSLLLADIRGVKSPLDVDTVGLVRALVRFDPIEIAMKVQSMTDAQNLVELIICLNKNKCFESWFGAAAHDVTRLALAIYGRVPLLPQSLFLNSEDLDYNENTYQGKAVITRGDIESVWRQFFDVFMRGSLSHGNMGPFLGAYSSRLHVMEVLESPPNGTLYQWRQGPNRSVSQIQQILFEVAKAIQYIHSLGIVLSYGPFVDDVYLDSDDHVKVQHSGFLPNGLCKGQLEYSGHNKDFTLETNVHSFGNFCYRILFNEYYHDTRPRNPEVPDNIWQLIQSCCAEDPKERPTMDQVVQEMGSYILLGQFTLSSHRSNCTIP